MPDQTERPGQPVVAAFDFDGTLSRGGSVWQFLIFVAGRTRVVAAGIKELPAIVRAAVVGGKANDVAKQALFVRVLGGRDAKETSGLAAEFGLLHFRRRRRPEICARLRWHLEQGHQVILASASPELYLVSVAEDLGIAGFVGTRLQVGNHGELTGNYEGANCRGQEKARRVREWIDASVSTSESDTAGSQAPFVWAYGNSAGDLQMLREADVGVDVGQLGRLGKLREFVRLRDLLAGGA